MADIDLTPAEEATVQELLGKYPLEELENIVTDAANKYCANMVKSKRDVLVAQEAYDRATLLAKAKQLSTKLSPTERAQLAQVLTATPIESEEEVANPGQ